MRISNVTVFFLEHPNGISFAFAHVLIAALCPTKENKKFLWNFPEAFFRSPGHQGNHEKNCYLVRYLQVYLDKFKSKFW